jgi:hypothetical protein
MRNTYALPGCYGFAIYPNCQNEWGESWREGNPNKTRLLSPALSSFLRQEEREKGSEIGHFSTCVDTNGPRQGAFCRPVAARRVILARIVIGDGGHRSLAESGRGRADATAFNRVEGHSPRFSQRKPVVPLPRNRPTSGLDYAIPSTGKDGLLLKERVLWTYTR